jgi:Rrf2 family protein
MISQTAEYALRAVVCLAESPTAPMINRVIAETTQVPPEYLSKVLQSLQRAGLVNSRRGLHGGFMLAYPAADVPVLAVINAVDPIKRIRSCPLARADHPTLCLLHQRLDDAAAVVEHTFRTTTIADLIRPNGSLCARPPDAGPCTLSCCLGPPAEVLPLSASISSDSNMDCEAKT